MVKSTSSSVFMKNQSTFWPPCQEMKDKLHFNAKLLYNCTLQHVLSFFLLGEFKWHSFCFIIYFGFNRKYPIDVLFGPTQAYVNLLFWYQFFCGFSATAMIDYWLMIFFNLLFTSAPPIMFGIMDKEVSDSTLLSHPELYRIGQHTEVSHPLWKSTIVKLTILT